MAKTITDVAIFLESPDLQKRFKNLNKEDLILLAEHYGIEVTGKKKALIYSLVEKKLIDEGLLVSSQNNEEVVTPNVDVNLQLQLELKKLELQAQKELEQKRMEMEMEQKRIEMEQKRMEMEMEMEQKKMEMESKERIEIERLRTQRDAPPQTQDSHRFDASRNIRLVPKFMEKSVDKYFPQFEKVAENLNWPRPAWTTLLQSVLTGKAAEVYSAMSLVDSSDYEKVKKAILKAYELVPEAYRQKFRNYKKLDGKTYVEFSREQEDLFDQWLRAKQVSDFDKLRQLMLVEQFKNCLFTDLRTHLDDKEVSTLNEAAVMSDSYALIHKRNFYKPRNFGGNRDDRNGDYSRRDGSFGGAFGDKPQDASNTTDTKDDKNKSRQSSEWSSNPKDRIPQWTADKKCNYCKKLGHIAAHCPVLKKKREFQKPVGFLSHEDTRQKPDIVTGPEKIMEDYQPYLSKGSVASNDDPSPVPVQILRDTGASQTLLLEGVLPLSDKTATGKSVLLRVVHLGTFKVPLHEVILKSKFITGPVTVGISPTLPVEGVSLLLGNDLASGKDILSPIVSDTNEICTSSDDKNEHLYPACVVTRAMAKEQVSSDNDETEVGNVNLGDTFFGSLNTSLTDWGKTGDTPQVKVFTKDKEKATLTRQQLIEEQKTDPETRSLIEKAVKFEEINEESECLYLKDGLLMRKWRPPEARVNEEWRVVHQIVVPKRYRQDILSLAHDAPLAGHLGISKTYSKILNHFFWPKLKKDVMEYCRSCHVCQMVGKPNQVIPPAPLQPIPAVDEAFSNILIDCVGPLPKSKSGNQYLLTIMCKSTRFPEAIPLRNITTKNVVKALTKFFCFVGVPKSCQHDQGTNFMSTVFKQVMYELGIQDDCSTAYHPESQGALERFHQTLKSMLKKYCFQYIKDWDEGVHYVLFAAREAVQESLGFSPFELIFGHSVRGPLSLMKEKWLTETSELNLLDYVSNFKERILGAVKLAQENMTQSQTRMKNRFDQKAKVRSFKPGDKVLVFLPIPYQPFQAKYFGPYEVEEKINDLNYVIKTTGHQKERRVCHINMIKEYVVRETKINTDRAADGVVSNIMHTHVSDCISNVSDIENDCATNVSDDVSVRDSIQSARLKNSDCLCKINDKLSHLSDTQKSEVISLLKDNMELFPDVPSKTTAAEHDVIITTDKPIKQHPYRLNPIKLKYLREEVQYMLDNDIIEPSTSGWSSPCILVPKPDGTYRFVTDFRKVNSVTKSDSYPIPRIDDCIDKLGGATFVSKFDLLKGFWQVPLTQRAKEITAFATPDNLYQYKVMPFGMKNSPATFQRMVHAVLQGLHGCEAYIDDVIVYSSTWEEHLSIMKELFSRLRKASLTINLAKCDFVHATVEYLGHIVGQGCVKPVDAKVDAIANYPAPTNKKDLMRFLGMVGFYRKFCHNFSTVVTPLTNLLQKKVKFIWTEGCETAFKNGKELLVNSPVLVSPDFQKQFKLAVDASDTGIGATLFQQSGDGIDKVVCFFSKKLNKYQRNYSTIEKECLALLLSLQHFDVYLNVTVHPVLVYTDHNPLTFLHKMANKNQRLTRWSLQLQQYDIVINHIKGKDNVIPDALSRV